LCADNDFRQRAAGTSAIADLLRSQAVALRRFEDAAEEALLVLTLPDGG
jgi:hypothetical protein